MQRAFNQELAGIQARVAEVVTDLLATAASLQETSCEPANFECFRSRFEDLEKKIQSIIDYTYLIEGRSVFHGDVNPDWNKKKES
jgi:hypothetical protein